MLINVIDMQNVAITLVLIVAITFTAIISVTMSDNAFARQSAALRYALGYQMGCTDGPDQENFVGTGGIHGHSKEFIKGYNKSFFQGCTHEDPVLQQEVEDIIQRHIHT